MAQVNKEEGGTLAASPVSSAAISGPKAIRYHAVADQELDSLMKFEKPIAVAFAAVFVGLSLGMAYQAYTAFVAILTNARPVEFLDLVFLVCSPTALGIGVTLAVVAARGRTEMVKALLAVRERAQVALPRGHPAAPTQKS